MVQGMYNQVQTQQYGLVRRVGIGQDGRVIYDVTNPLGQSAGKLSVAPQDCDTFEKSYQKILKAAPKLQAASDKYSDPVKIEKMQKTSKWITIGGAVTGFVVPAILTRKWKTVPQLLTSFVGCVAGLVGGANLSALITSPPGALAMAKATKTISKLDIRPYEIEK